MSFLLMHNELFSVIVVWVKRGCSFEFLYSISNYQLNVRYIYFDQRSLLQIVQTKFLMCFWIKKENHNVFFI